MTTVRTILAVAVIEDLYKFQIDVTNAFHEDLFETHVYMKMLQGYTRYGSRIQLNYDSNSHTTPTVTVCKNKKIPIWLKTGSKAVVLKALRETDSIRIHTI